MCLLIAGSIVELAVCWLCVISPQLTADYNPEFTRQFVERFGLPSLQLDGAPPATLLGALEIGLMAMSVGYLLALAVLSGWLRNDRLGKLLVVGFSLVFQLTFLAMPGFYSTDVFSYVMYGRIAGVYAQNPYIAVPSSFVDDPFLNWVFPFWQHTPSIYGPLWTDVSALLSNATATASALDQVLAYKLLISASALVCLGLVWVLIDRAPWRRGPALACFALYAWNPIVLLELAGNAHNDALMLMLLLLSILPLTARQLRARHWLAAVLIATASALIKYATAPVVAYYIAASSRRWSTVLIALGAVFGPVTVLTWPYLQSADALRPLTNAAGGGLVANSIPELMPGSATRLVCVLAYAGVLVWDAVHVWRIRTPAATLEAGARALLLLPVLVLTWVWSWYFTWSIAIVSVLGIRTKLAQTTIAISMVAPPVFYAHQYLNESMPSWLLLVYVVVPLLLVVPRPSAGVRYLQRTRGVAQ